MLDAWRHGDSRAMAELLRSYQARVYAVCYRMLRRPEDATDLTQDALVKILEGLHTYDGRSQLSTWVIRVAMNCCLSHLRKQKLRRHVSLDDPGQRSGSWGSIAGRLGGDAAGGPSGQAAGRSGTGRTTDSMAEPGGVRRVEHDEQRVALLRALDRLDPEARAILVLRDTQDLEYQHIGEILDVPIGTVKSRLFRARMALRDLVSAELGVSQSAIDATSGSKPRTNPGVKPEATTAVSAMNVQSVKSAKNPAPPRDARHVEPEPRSRDRSQPKRATE